MNKQKSTASTGFFVATILSILGLVAIDRLTKHLAVTQLMNAEPNRILPGLLRFVYVENTGISFGMFSGAGLRIVFCVLVAAVVVGLSYYLLFKRPKGIFLNIALVMIIAGGIGNLIDRIVLGYVIDFILFEFDFFPYVFNFADMCVVLGSIVLVLALIFTPSGTKADKTDAEA